jgi:sugar lactone lactonase YvrE
MYGAKTDLMRGRPIGRLLRDDPSTDQSTVLARYLYFPNGIAVNDHETMLFVVLCQDLCSEIV